MSTETTIQPPPHSAASIGKAALLALAVACAVLAAFVLPAEYGLDPLGIGKATGLLNINASGATAPIVPIVAASGGPVANQSKGYKTDAIEFTLVPMGSVEYKYHLDKGGTMIYQWKATGPVEFDMHTEPDEGGAAASDSFEAGQATAKNGTYTAPYAGIHGWYWQNRSDKDVKIVLQTAGFYDAAKMFDESGDAQDMLLTDPPPPPEF